MLHDIKKIAGESYDLIIIGGGITGCGIAWVGALAGLRTILIEQNDFGGVTSAGNFKTIHGGLRYLQHFDLARLRESVIEQTTLFDLARGQLAELPFMVPCYGYGMKGSEALKIALQIYKTLAPERKTRISEARFLTKKETLSYAEHLPQGGLRGSGVFFDLQMKSTDRFTFNILKTAQREGAAILNYVDLINSEIKNNTLTSITIKDRFSDVVATINGRYFVNATGNKIKNLEAQLTKKAVTQKTAVLSKGFQVVLKDQISKYGIALPSTQNDPTSKISRGNRSYFILPWGKRSILGTTDHFDKFNSETFCVQEKEVETFVEDVFSVYPDQRINSQYVEEVFGGYLPVESPKPGVYRIRKEDILEKSNFAENLFNVFSVKYTTFRALALNTLGLIRKEILTKELKKINFKRIEFLPIWGSEETQPTEDLPERIKDLIPGQACRIKDAIGKKPEIIAADLAAGEIDYYVDEEHVQRLSDLLFRRTNLRGLSKVEVGSISSYLAKKLGWSEARREDEVSDVFKRSGNVILWQKPN